MKNIHQKAIFLDLDGTLLNDAKEITAGNRDAIERALEKGHKVIINTGRPLGSAVIQAERLGLTAPGCYLISFNGGIVFDMGERKIIHQKTLPLEVVRHVMEEANRRGIHVQTYDDKDVLVQPINDDPEIRRYCSIIHATFRVIPDLEALVQEPPKVLIIDYENKQPLIEFQNWLNDWGKGIVDNFFSCDYYVEIVPVGLNKGSALRRMAQQLGIAIEDTICAGDAANDLAMLSAAGVGCAMANATDEVKALADYVTVRDNNHDGIAEIIERFVL